MKIRYLGHSSFLICGNEKSVVTDPFDGIGYPMERVFADYCTVSHDHFDHNNVGGVDCRKIIRETTDGFLSIDTYHDSTLGKLRGYNTVFKFSVDGVIFCHLGDIGEHLSDSLIDEIGKVDVLFIPVGGKYTIDGKEAADYVINLHPKIVIPMHYKTNNLNIDVDSVDKFLYAAGCPYENVGNEIELNKNDLPASVKIYVMRALYA